MPVKLMPKPEKLPALIGLLYVREALQLEDQMVQQGLYPVTQVASGQSSLRSNTSKVKNLTRLGRSINMPDNHCKLVVTIGITVTDGVAIVCEFPIPDPGGGKPAPPPPPPGGGIQCACPGDPGTGVWA